MRAGQLDQRVRVLAATITKNSLNEDVPGWAETIAVWARVVEGRGRDFVKGAAVVEQALVAFQLRWRAGVGSGNRVVWRGRLFEIVEATGTRRSGELWLHGREIAGEIPA